MLLNRIMLLPRKFLAIVFACDKFRPYIVDRKLLFILITLLLDILWQRRMLSRGLLDECYFYKSLICIL
jgi:hypothetical protein